MPTATTNGNGPVVVSALSLRTDLGKILRRVDVEWHLLVIERRGTPTAFLMNFRDHVKLVAPEPEGLQIIGDEAKCDETNALTSLQIDRIINAARSEKKKR